MLKNLKPKEPQNPIKYIAHFGGSFNPVHNGHLLIADILINKYKFDEVIFVPNGNNYPKPGLAGENNRYTLLKKAVYAQPNLSISQYELNQNKLVNTIQTVTYLTQSLEQKYEQFKLFCIRGADAVWHFRNWHSLPQLCELATILIIPRENINMKHLFEENVKLKSLASNFKIIDETFPEISSTLIRKELILSKNIETAKRYVPSEVAIEIENRGMYGISIPGNNWISIARPGISGKSKKTRDVKRNDILGIENYRTAFRWNGKIVTYPQALQLYEDAYMHHFKKIPDDLEWLIKNAREVYDNSQTNILSELDYNIQEESSTHLQDISVRRCLFRLGLEFQGDHLIEIRGRNSEGYRLNPGQVKFHLPEKIISPQISGWWQQDSVESFWQSNKVLQVKEKVFDQSLQLKIHLLFKNKSDALARISNNKTDSLPLLIFNQGQNFVKIMNQFLLSWDSQLDDFTLMTFEPVYQDKEVNILLKTDKIPKKLSDGYDYFPISEIKSSIRDKILKQLLKNEL